MSDSGTLCHFAALHKLVAIAVIADIDQAAKQFIAHMEKEWIASVFTRCASTDAVVAEPVIGRAFARPVGSSQWRCSENTV
jgi:hypothetical protein